MKKIIILFITFLLAAKFSTSEVAADDLIVSQSAKFKRVNVEKKFDLRLYRLQKYLENHDSPLSNFSQEFIVYADKYNLDYRLVPAIAGVESTFGKRIPKGSFNAYGWANGNFYFDSWGDSIETVSATLREKYYDKGATNLNKIARRYAPPSNTWRWKVKYFMDKIDPVPVEFDL